MLYKGKYFFAFYDKNDRCVGICDNVYEFSRLAENPKLRSCYNALYKIANHTRNYVWIKGEICKGYMYEADDD